MHPHKLRQIAPLFKLEVVDSEQAVFLEGDVPDKLYILLNGSVDLVKILLEHKRRGDRAKSQIEISN